MPGATHLTTLMCPRYRRQVLEGVRARLKEGESVRLAATSLIEAGVDVDFADVWRAAAGLDLIAQAAGRCNREGKLDKGRTVVFVPAEGKPPRELEAFWQATRPVLREHQDILGLESIRAYFHQLYWQKSEAAFDALELDGRRGILPALSEGDRSSNFPFRSIAEAFHLIDDVMEPVIIPWDKEAEELLDSIARPKRPSTRDLRRLQQYVVSIPRKARDAWLHLGALHVVNPAFGRRSTRL